MGHKHFNPVTLPRHVALEDGKLRLRYVDAQAKEVITIPPGEFDNVGFDGSWDHAYYLLDSKGLRAMAVSRRASPVPGARWRERERDGLYERVLWDDKRALPLVDLTPAFRRAGEDQLAQIRVVGMAGRHRKMRQRRTQPAQIEGLTLRGNRTARRQSRRAPAPQRGQLVG